jgi:hypothetical protein
MTSGKKLLLALILLPVAAVLGIKGYIAYNTKKTLEQLTAMAAPFVSIRYQGVSSTLGGSVSIEDVRLQPVGLTDVIPLEEIRIDTPGLGYLLSARSRLESGEYPERLQLRLRGLGLDLVSPMMSGLEQFLATAADVTGMRAMPHCGGLRYLGPRQYRQFGYETLVMDITLGYQLEKLLDRTVIKFDWITRDMASLESTITLAGGAAALKPGAGAAPQVSQVRAVYRDLSYMDRIKRYCAEASKISVEDYVRAETEQDDTAYAGSWGFVPGPGLRAAYRQFLEKPGEVVVEARPADGLDPKNLALYKPEDMIAMLNLSVQVNGTPVTDLSFRADATREKPAATGEQAAPQPELAATSPPAAAPERASAAPAVPAEAPGYRSVNLATLPQHIGRELRVTAAGKMRDGILAEVHGGNITLERPYAGGRMTFKVPLSHISKVEVLF